MRARPGLLAAVVLVALAVPAASHAATTQTFTTSQSEFTPGVRNQGWWSDGATTYDANDNYVASPHDFTNCVDDRPTGGSLRCAGPYEVRNFFTFDVSSACRAASVTLELTRYGQTGAATYSLFDVSTPAAELNANGPVNPSIFDDLGTGAELGSYRVEPGAASDVLSFPFDRAGVAAFNAARGGFFSVGGVASDVAGPPDALGSLAIFDGSTGGTSASTQQLVVTCAAPRRRWWPCPPRGWRGFPFLWHRADCVAERWRAQDRLGPPR